MIKEIELTQKQIEGLIRLSKAIKEIDIGLHPKHKKYCGFYFNDRREYIDFEDMKSYLSLEENISDLTDDEIYEAYINRCENFYSNGDIIRKIDNILNYNNLLQEEMIFYNLEELFNINSSDDYILQSIYKEHFKEQVDNLTYSNKYDLCFAN